MQQTKKRSLRLLLLLVMTFMFISALSVRANAQKEQLYIPGGMPFGAKIYSDGLIVSNFSEPTELGIKENPAKKAGFSLGDIIIKVNNTPIKSPSALSECVTSSNGQEIKVTIQRNSKETVLNIKPVKCSDGEYRLGVNVKDSMAGIGTVTYISADSGEFGGLGHGICDTNTGNVIPLARGTVSKVKINSIMKSENGRPGEIRGSFLQNKTGALLKNTECGVFGILGSVPENIKPMPIAKPCDVKEGEAYILCTLDSEGVKSYKIEIEKIDRDISHTTKNMQIKVIDPALLEKTNGIVQGMSGSPIIQNGKIAGAVTHVMIDNTAKGYGIFAENMLKAAKGA